MSDKDQALASYTLAIQQVAEASEHQRKMLLSIASAEELDRLLAAVNKAKEAAAAAGATNDELQDALIHGARSTDQRIADALERIVDALDTIYQLRDK